MIPNLEIRKIFLDQFLEWFQQEARLDTPKLDAFCEAFAAGDAQAAQEHFNAYLSRTISIRDAGARKGQKENFYHGILLGLLSHREDWYLESNGESGNGYSDILIEDEANSIGMIIEIKYPDNGDLTQGCLDALAQIESRKYADRLKQDGLETILQYGIACNRKKCRIMFREAPTGSLPV